ncbi:serine hydrolase domain-containing protein, partial [Actinoplanes sp. NPDC051633]|uniref:serine hydrolase domain-containing protein n=1 Tax=Actinoplanes sp. NPDC051633 TaxID=3155670 RepID=UPI003434C15C
EAAADAEGDPPPAGVGGAAASSYSNVGYVLLAEAVARTTGTPLATFAKDRIFTPLGMADTLFWAGPEPSPPGAVQLDPRHPAPLSIGDGGLWSTAEDLLRWAEALDTDRLGITGLLQTPVLGYAWGMGVREHAGHRIYRHGGSYADVRTMLVRVPGTGFDLVVLAARDRSERRTDLTDRLLEALVT